MIELDILGATARQDGRPIDLPPRELALLCALALGPRVWPSYLLIPLLWPESPSPQSSSLKVYVHRLRRRLGCSIIASTNKGYELRPDVQIDLWKAESLARTTSWTEAERHTLSRFYIKALTSDRSFLNRWDWFAGTEDLIKASLCAIAVRLAQDSVDRGQREEAMTILRTAFSLDPGQEKLLEYEATLAGNHSKVVPLRRYIAPRQASAHS